MEQNTFYLDKEKDIVVELLYEDGQMQYVLRTPNHGTGNLITNLAKLCDLPLSRDGNGLLVIRGTLPCYVDGDNRTVYILRLGNTKVANIFADGRVERKAHIPAISKTLMSQTKDYRLDEKRTIVKTWIRQECKFHADLHTHMNANLQPDILIALGICHQIRYPMYYVKKLNLRLSAAQEEMLSRQRAAVAEVYRDSGLEGKYLDRRIDDNTHIGFADLLLNNRENAAYNIPRIRASLAVMKDGQAVFTNLEKVYLYRYVFTKGVPVEDGGQTGSAWTPDACPARFDVTAGAVSEIPDANIAQVCLQILRDRTHPVYRNNTIFEDKLLWIARSYAAVGVRYAEISDTTLVKKDGAAQMLAAAHRVMPAVTAETGVVLRFLAAIRRIPLTIVKDRVWIGDYFRENLQVLSAVASDPYVAGSDILGEEINDIRELSPVISEIVRIAGENAGFTVRIHAGENDSLRDNVINSIRCIRDALAPGQAVPPIRIGHGLYTANLKSAKGRALIAALKESGAVLEFQITSNVRLNNLSAMENHPLRQYLAAGIPCVQGTDGGALYGTDSIDEQLSLEKMLGLSFDELRRMQESEAAVIREALDAFAEKQRISWEEEVRGLNRPADARNSGLQARIDAAVTGEDAPLVGDRRLVTAEVLADRIAPLPKEGKAIVIAGGSFNSDRHSTRVRPDEKQIVDRLLAEGDPAQQFFVIGHRLSGYERYLVEQNRQRYGGAYRIFAFVPAMISERERRRLAESGVSVRPSIEPAAMGLYKSIAYEVFKQRSAVLYAFDGNSAGANLIQEAKNAKYKSEIFVSAHCRVLAEKARSLEGYVRLM